MLRVIEQCTAGYGQFISGRNTRVVVDNNGVGAKSRSIEAGRAHIVLTRRADAIASRHGDVPGILTGLIAPEALLIEHPEAQTSRQFLIVARVKGQAQGNVAIALIWFKTQVMLSILFGQFAFDRGAAEGASSNYSRRGSCFGGSSDRRCGFSCGWCGGCSLCYGRFSWCCFFLDDADGFDLSTAIDKHAVIDAQCKVGIASGIIVDDDGVSAAGGAEVGALLIVWPIQEEISGASADVVVAQVLTGNNSRQVGFIQDEEPQAILFWVAAIPYCCYSDDAGAFWGDAQPNLGKLAARDSAGHFRRPDFLIGGGSLFGCKCNRRQRRDKHCRHQNWC